MVAAPDRYIAHMDCPKCGFDLAADAADCPRCGIVVAKFRQWHDEAGATAQVWHAAPASEDSSPVVTLEGRTERMMRAGAMPGACLTAWIAVRTAPGAVRMLSMWVHESGHAVAAWLCGYSAWPGPWFTPVSMERSPSLTVLLLGLLGAGAYQAWKRGRWFWVFASAVAMCATLFCTLVVGPGRAQQIIVFGGDGGCFVLGTMLMCTVYAREESPVHREHSRWALLVIGALAFMDALAVWSGPIDRLPFGENENGFSDPSVLTEIYGWSVLTLTARYGQLARACTAILAGVYLWGLRPVPTA